MKLTEKCVVLPYERYAMLLQSGSGTQNSESKPAIVSPSQQQKDTKEIDVKEDTEDKQGAEPKSPAPPPKAVSPISKSTVTSNTLPPPPGLPYTGRKRKLFTAPKERKRNNWRNLWTSI